MELRRIRTLGVTGRFEVVPLVVAFGTLLEISIWGVENRRGTPGCGHGVEPVSWSRRAWPSTMARQTRSCNRAPLVDRRLLARRRVPRHAVTRGGSEQRFIIVVITRFVPELVDVPGVDAPGDRVG